MNLLFDEWIPVTLSDGKTKIAPWQLTANGCSARAVKSVRPDFDAALLHFLIGLFQYAFFEKDEAAWVDRFYSPPSPDEVKARFLELDIKSAFELLGDGSRFMQEPIKSFSGEIKTIGIGHLLIDYPPRKKIDDGNDALAKHEVGRRLCLPCCANALYALQSFTGYGGGGGGYRSSIHSGTPVTTFITGSTLWETIWLNVLSAETSAIRIAPQHIDKMAVFPWLRDSILDWVGKGKPARYYNANQPEDFYSLYWSIPRRIRLGNIMDGFCFLCGEQGKTIGHFHTASFGISYEPYWPHPLVPVQLFRSANEDSQDKNNLADDIDEIAIDGEGIQESLFKPGSLVGSSLESYSYLKWIGLALSDWGNDKKRVRPARVVSTYIGRRAEEISRRAQFTQDSHDQKKISLWVCGFIHDFNLQVCHQFINAQVPIVIVRGGTDGTTMQALFERAARGIVNDANIVALALSSKLAKIVGSDSSRMAAQEFALRTEGEFYRLLRDAAGDPVEYGRDWEIHGARCGPNGWRRYLVRHATVAFDNAVDLMQITNPSDITEAVKARRSIDRLGTVKLRKDKKDKPHKKSGTREVN